MFNNQNVYANATHGNVLHSLILLFLFVLISDNMNTRLVSTTFFTHKILQTLKSQPVNYECQEAIKAKNEREKMKKGTKTCENTAFPPKKFIHSRAKKLFLQLGERII